MIPVFDIIELSSQYSKSCSQVLLRMGEVLHGKLFMYAALYEPNAENELHVTYWTAATMKPTLTRMSSEQTDFSLEREK